LFVCGFSCFWTEKAKREGSVVIISFAGVSVRWWRGDAAEYPTPLKLFEVGFSSSGKQKMAPSVLMVSVMFSLPLRFFLSVCLSVSLNCVVARLSPPDRSPVVNASSSK
jgi:hypothetical protein